MNAVPSYSNVPSLISRPSRDRRPLFFRAGEEGLEVLEYLLAYFAPLYGFGLVQCVVMPDELTLSLRNYGGGDRSKFQATVLNIWVRTMNKLIDRRGSMIESEPTDCTYLLDAEAEMDELMDAALEPVRRGFVPNSRLWPGTLFTPEDAGEERVIQRPACLNPKGYDDEVRYTVVAPRHQANESASTVRDGFRERRRREERRIKTQFKRQRRPFLGVDGAFALDPSVVPPAPPTKEQREMFRASDSRLLDAALAKYVEFLKHYAECLQALRDGVIDIVWPPGTNFHHFVNGFERESGALCLALARAPKVAT